jgi:hypothetical protein
MHPICHKNKHEIIYVHVHFACLSTFLKRIILLCVFTKQTFGNLSSHTRIFILSLEKTVSVINSVIKFNITISTMLQMWVS